VSESDGAEADSLGSRSRLLILTPDFPPARGGIQVLIHRLSVAMTGFQTQVVTMRAPGAERFDAQSELRPRRVRAAGGAPGRAVALNAASIGQGVRFRPDVTLSAHVLTSPGAAVIRRLAGGATAQYFYANEIVGKPRLSAYAAGRADISIAISAYTESLVRATGARAADMRVIAPGVDLPSDPAPLPAERPTVLTVARLNDAYKGHDVLIRSLALVREVVPEVQWVVIGDGPLRPQLEALVHSSVLAGSTRFLGEVSDEERDTWLRRADLFAMPSRLPEGGLAGEGFGIVYLEASAYGKPVVAGNVGGARDAVADGETGLLVDPTDPSAVAGAISSLLLDRKLAQRLGRAGADRAREFAWPVIAGKVQAALLEALARRT
jgi:phosphatidylinositol alpha-1,6-mannosyltransferase